MTPFTLGSDTHASGDSSAVSGPTPKSLDALIASLRSSGPKIEGFLLEQMNKSKTPKATSAPTVLRHYLPWEMLAEICRHADVPTVLALCLTSFGMVQLAGPLLYEKITVVHINDLISLLYRTTTVPYTSRLRAHVGLHLVRELALHIDHNWAPGGRDRLLSIHPPKGIVGSGSGPLKLDVLSLQDDMPAGTGWLFPFYLSHLVEYFDPATLELVAHPNTVDIPVYTQFIGPFTQWTRLSLVICSGVFIDIETRGIRPVSFVACAELFPDEKSRPRCMLDYRRTHAWFVSWATGRSLSRSKLWTRLVKSEVADARRKEWGSTEDARPGRIEVLVSDKEDHAALLQAVGDVEVEWERALFKVVLKEQA